MSNTRNKLDIFAERIWFMGWALLCLVVSMIYQTKTGNLRFSLFDLDTSAINLVLGIMNGLCIFNYVNACRSQINTSISLTVFEVFIYSFLSWGMFNVVLFPLSGFGCLEYCFLIVYLFANIFCLNIKTGNISFGGQNPFSSFILFGVLWVFKVIVFYFFDNSLYIQFIEGNTLMRWVILIITVIGACNLLSHLMRIGRASSEIAEDKKNNLMNYTRRTVKLITTGIAKFISLIASIMTGWVGLVIILAVALLGFGIGFLVIDWFFESVMAVIEPFLEKVLTTGENARYPGALYSVCQIFSFLIYAAMVLYLYLKSKIEISQKIENQLDSFILKKSKYVDFDKQYLKENTIRKIADEKNDFKKISISNDIGYIESVVKNVMKENIGFGDI